MSIQGMIKKKADRGFGFISFGNNEEIFFNSNSLVGVTIDELQEGDSVLFEIIQQEKGTIAVNVNRV